MGWPFNGGKHARHGPSLGHLAAMSDDEPELEKRQQGLPQVTAIVQSGNVGVGLGGL